MIDSNLWQLDRYHQVPRQLIENRVRHCLNQCKVEVCTRIFLVPMPRPIENFSTRSGAHAQPQAHGPFFNGSLVMGVHTSNDQA